MANIRNKHASLPGHKMPLDARAYYEDITDSIIPIYPIYIQATHHGARKISFSDHSRSVKNVNTHRLQSMQNRSIKSEIISPFVTNNSVQCRI